MNITCVFSTNPQCLAHPRSSAISVSKSGLTLQMRNWEMRGDFSDSMEKGTPGARTHLADYRCAAIIPCRSVTQVISHPNHGSLTSEILFVFPHLKETINILGDL